MKIERELMRGAGPIAILRLLEGGERYGYELVRMIDLQSDGVLKMGQSTLYPLLYNLQAKGLVTARIATADSGRPRKYYRLTDSGKHELSRGRKQWKALSLAMGRLGVIGG